MVGNSYKTNILGPKLSHSKVDTGAISLGHDKGIFSQGYISSLLFDYVFLCETKLFITICGLHAGRWHRARFRARSGCSCRYVSFSWRAGIIGSWGPSIITTDLETGHSSDTHKLNNQHFNVGHTNNDFLYIRRWINVDMFDTSITGNGMHNCPRGNVEQLYFENLVHRWSKGKRNISAGRFRHWSQRIFILDDQDRSKRRAVERVVHSILVVLCQAFVESSIRVASLVSTSVSLTSNIVGVSVNFKAK